MGRVCRICDRKFFLRESFEKHAKKIKQYSDMESKKVSETYKKESKLQDLQNQIMIYKQNCLDEEVRHD